MPDYIQPFWFNILGGVLALAGTAVLFLDLRGDSIAAKASDVQIYIGRLDQQIEELSQIPKDRGLKTPEGIDIGEAFEIMYEGARAANRKNRDTYLNLLEEVKTEQDKHRWAQKIAIALVLLGGCLQIVGGLL